MYFFWQGMRISYIAVGKTLPITVCFKKKQVTFSLQKATRDGGR